MSGVRLLHLLHALHTNESEVRLLLTEPRYLACGGLGAPSAITNSSNSWSTFVNRLAMLSVRTTAARGNDGVGVRRAFEIVS